MEEKNIIPIMEEEIAKWYKNIRPIVKSKAKNNCENKSVYLRKLKNDELTNLSYTWLQKQKDYAEEVEYEKLSVLADVKMLHRFGLYGFFKPSVSEVICQIPKELLPKVIAFEIIYSPISNSDFNLFKKEFDACFHVSVVRLYQVKCNEEHLCEDDIMQPIGMTKEEFEKYKELILQRQKNDI